MTRLNSNVRLYNSQRIKIAYLSVSVRTPPNLLPFSKKPPSSVYIFSIDKETGGMYHGGFPNIDIFPNENAFFNFLKSMYAEIFDIEDLGTHLIGATVSGNQFIIVSVKEKEEVARIFNQPIYKITNVNYKYIPLWNTKQPTNTILQNFNICYNHFFCPTLDISSRFPYPKYTISNKAFCWNKRFLIPFEENHALNACIIVLQGAVFSMSKEYSSGFNIFYVVKRSAMFPGTRYNARGLNSTIDPANECECDLIFLEDNKYYAQSWRRGSPPVLWETEIKNLVMANHVVKENANNDTPMYFLDSIIQRFETEKICVISLLQKNGQEKRIDEVYSEGVETLSNVFPHVTLKYTNFDINALLKEKGIDNMVSEFYSLISNDINESNFTVVDSKTGDYHISNKDNHQKRQKTVFRFNCADSLDRTNVATFFYSLVLTAKFIMKSGCEEFKKPDFKGEIQLTHPIDSLNKKVIDFLGECFIISGNIISLMYTNTDAIKTHIIRHFMTPTKEGTKDSDKVVSVYRRFQNCIYDGTRQAIIEEWTSTMVKNSQFTLDEQHISLLSRIVYEKTSIVHQILESPIQKFTLLPKGDNIVVVMFPEPFLLCSISIFVVPNLLSSLCNITLTVDSDLDSHSLFFHNITLPLFSEYRTVSLVDTAIDGQDKDVKGVWVTYDIRKMAKLSNYYPIDPLCLQPTSFVSVKFSAFCKKMNLGNIRFRVKRPNNPRKCYYITGKPPFIQGKTAYEHLTEIYKNLDYRHQTLSELRSIELTRIEFGINDYYRNNYLVRLKRNPWVYDLRSYSLRKNKDLLCINCGEKANDYDKSPPFFIPDSMYPITCVKTDKLDESNKKSAIVLCKDCKTIFDEQMQIQLYILKNVSSKALIDVNEYVGFYSTTFSHYEGKPFELNHMAKVFLSTLLDADDKKLRKLLTGGDAEIEIVESSDQKIILCYPIGVCLDTITVNFMKPVPPDLFNMVLTIYDDEGLKKATLTSLDIKQVETVSTKNDNNNNNINEDQKDDSNSSSDDDEESDDSSDSNSRNNENANLPKSTYKFKISDIPPCVQSIKISFDKNPIAVERIKKENENDENAENSNYPDLDIILNSLYITGIFKYVSTRTTIIQSSPQLKLKFDQEEQIQESTEKSKKKKPKKKEEDEEGNALPRFSETRCKEWNPTFRTQEFRYKKKSILGYAIKPPQNRENRAHSLILGFFNNNKYISHESIIIPTEIDNDEIMYFPVSSRPSDFNSIIVFYLDRIGFVEPYKFMFFD